MHGTQEVELLAVQEVIVIAVPCSVEVLSLWAVVLMMGMVTMRKMLELVAELSASCCVLTVKEEGSCCCSTSVRPSQARTQEVIVEKATNRNRTSSK